MIDNNDLIQNKAILGGLFLPISQQDKQASTGRMILLGLVQVSP